MTVCHQTASLPVHHAFSPSPAFAHETKAFVTATRYPFKLPSFLASFVLAITCLPWAL